jgi:hypothetical protein
MTAFFCACAIEAPDAIAPPQVAELAYGEANPKTEAG